MTETSNQSRDIILRTTGVGKTFGKFVALNNISAEFPKGAITSIIGPNGEETAPSPEASIDTPEASPPPPAPGLSLADGTGTGTLRPPLFKERE